MTALEPLMPEYTAGLFPGLNAELVRLLRGLSVNDWQLPTVAKGWRVRDVVAHLLDVHLRKLAGGRDGHAMSGRSVSSFAEIVDLINEMNAGGVSYGTRLSPRLMTDLIEVTGGWVSAFVAELPPHAEARWAVAWAGEQRSPNWMDTGREYTEHWHHQMQIRDAVGAPGLLQHRWFHPFLALSVRAFRRTYKDVIAPVGEAIVFEVESEGDNVWSVVREHAGWDVMRGRAPNPAAHVRTDGDSAWKLLYNALSPEEARRRVALSGNRALAAPMLDARSVMV